MKKSMIMMILLLLLSCRSYAIDKYDLRDLGDEEPFLVTQEVHQMFSMYHPYHADFPSEYRYYIYKDYVYYFSDWMGKGLYRVPVVGGERELVREEIFKWPAFAEFWIINNRIYFVGITEKGSSYMGFQPKFYNNLYSMNLTGGDVTLEEDSGGVMYKYFNNCFYFYDNGIYKVDLKTNTKEVIIDKKLNTFRWNDFGLVYAIDQDGPLFFMDLAEETFVLENHFDEYEFADEGLPFIFIQFYERTFYRDLFSDLRVEIPFKATNIERAKLVETYEKPLDAQDYLEIDLITQEIQFRLITKKDPHLVITKDEQSLAILEDIGYEAKYIKHPTKNILYYIKNEQRLVEYSIDTTLSDVVVYGDKLHIQMSDDQYIYFRNKKKVMRYSFETKDSEVVLNDHLGSYDIFGNYMVYWSGDRDDLIRLDMDTGDAIKLEPDKALNYFSMKLHSENILSLGNYLFIIGEDNRLKMISESSHTLGWYNQKLYYFTSKELIAYDPTTFENKGFEFPWETGISKLYLLDGYILAVHDKNMYLFDLETQNFSMLYSKAYLEEYIGSHIRFKILNEHTIGFYNYNSRFMTRYDTISGDESIVFIGSRIPLYDYGQFMMYEDYKIPERLDLKISYDGKTLKAQNDMMPKMVPFDDADFLKRDINKMLFDLRYANLIQGEDQKIQLGKIMTQEDLISMITNFIYNMNHQGAQFHNKDTWYYKRYSQMMAYKIIPDLTYPEAEVTELQVAYSLSRALLLTQGETIPESISSFSWEAQAFLLSRNLNIIDNRLLDEKTIVKSDAIIMLYNAYEIRQNELIDHLLILENYE